MGVGRETADKLDFGTITNAVVRVDPVTDQPGDPIRLQPKAAAVGFHHSGSQIAVGGGSVWVIDGPVPWSVSTRRQAATQVVPDDGYRASAVTFGDGAAWVLGERAEQAGSPEGPFVWRIDPQTLHPSDRIRVQESGASDLAVGAGSVWVASPWDGLVARIHPAPRSAPKRSPPPEPVRSGSTSPAERCGSPTRWGTPSARSTPPPTGPGRPWSCPDHRRGSRSPMARSSPQ